MTAVARKLSGSGMLSLMFPVVAFVVKSSFEGGQWNGEISLFSRQVIVMGLFMLTPFMSEFVQYHSICRSRWEGSCTPDVAVVCAP